jgi:hypothetical protein
MAEATTPRDVLVADCTVPGKWIDGHGTPIRAAPRLHRRQLNRSQIRRLLRASPKLRRDTLIDIIFDESWSVRGGNDVVGLRHELILIALEHLGGNFQRRGKWIARLSTFDMPSAFELPATSLTRRGLKVAEEVLLRGSPGGCSILGPSLRRAEESASRFTGLDRLLVVLSDFELFDQPSPQASLQKMIDSSATQVLAISLNNEPPDVLVDSRVRIARVAAGDSPADLANHVIDAAHVCAEQIS